MKKTSNKGFSMVELIIVIAIMAILAAALAPSLIKYINKSRLSTDVTTGTTIATSINSALAVESAYNACPYNDTQTVALDTILNASDSFTKEVKSVMGLKDSDTTLKGKAKKDLGGNAISQTFYVNINQSLNKVSVWYGTTDDAHLVSPTVGTSIAD